MQSHRAQHRKLTRQAAPVGAVGCSHDNDVSPGLQAVHEREQLGYDAPLHLTLRHWVQGLGIGLNSNPCEAGLASLSEDPDRLACVCREAWQAPHQLNRLIIDLGSRDGVDKWLGVHGCEVWRVRMSV